MRRASNDVPPSPREEMQNRCKLDAESPQLYLPAISNQVGVKPGMLDFYDSSPFPFPPPLPPCPEKYIHIYTFQIYDMIGRNCVFYILYLHNFYLSIQGFPSAGDKNSLDDEGCHTF